MSHAMLRPVVAVALLALAADGALIAQRHANQSRGAARTTVNASHNRNTNVNANRNTNINSNRNVNIDRDIDIDIDVDRRYGGYGGCCYHPIATAAAITTAAVVTAAVIGSRVTVLPPACTVVIVGSISYQQCGSTWYQPQFSGPSVTYIVVNPPR